MRLTRDEARILKEALKDFKFTAVESFNKEIGQQVYSSLETLEQRLEIFGDDLRRKGRTSQNNFYDCLKRYAKKGGSNV